MTGVCEVIITAPDAEWLVAFTRRLIEDHLCASGHHVERIRTLYRWQGEIHDAVESRAALRTRTELVPSIIERANEEHPYEVPSVIALPITTANPDYVAWILAETQRP